MLSDAWIARAVLLATALLVLHAVGAWAYPALGVTAAIASAGLVGAVAVFGARMAGRGRSNAWFVVPALLFTALPLAARVATLASGDGTWWTRSVELAPLLIGFAAPVLLLLAAYLGLEGRIARAARRDPGPAAADYEHSDARRTVRRYVG
jgi:hypothetical protein